MNNNRGAYLEGIFYYTNEWPSSRLINSKNGTHAKSSSSAQLLDDGSVKVTLGGGSGQYSLYYLIDGITLPYKIATCGPSLQKFSLTEKAHREGWKITEQTGTSFTVKPPDIMITVMNKSPPPVKLIPGDHICVLNYLSISEIESVKWYHHGIYVGYGYNNVSKSNEHRVVHAYATPSNWFTNGFTVKIVMQNVVEFAGSRETLKNIRVLRDSTNTTTDINTVNRAIQAVGQSFDWHPLNNNCEHWARNTKENNNISYQSEIVGKDINRDSLKLLTEYANTIEDNCPPPKLFYNLAGQPIDIS